MGLNRINKLYNKLWSQQEPFDMATVCKQTLDYYLHNNMRDFKKFLKNEQLRSYQLFNNVYVFNNDKSICDCKSPMTVVHVDKETYLNKETNKCDNPIWLPNFKSMLDHIDESIDFEVFPMEESWLGANKVCYKNICCKDDTWKYLTYHKAIGLRYSHEESDCISNYRSFDLDKSKNITSEYLEENLPMGSLILLDIKKHDLKSQNINNIRMWLEALLGTVKSKSYEILIRFSGLNDPLSNLYEHKDVRKYVTKLLNEIPEILWFLKERADLAVIYCAKVDKNGNLIYRKDSSDSEIAIDGEKSNDITRNALNAIYKHSYFNDYDLLKFMKEFNEGIGIEIYDYKGALKRVEELSK